MDPTNHTPRKKKVGIENKKKKKKTHARYPPLRFFGLHSSTSTSRPSCPSSIPFPPIDDSPKLSGRGRNADKAACGACGGSLLFFFLVSSMGTKTALVSLDKATGRCAPVAGGSLGFC